MKKVTSKLANGNSTKDILNLVHNLRQGIPFVTTSIYRVKLWKDTNLDEYLVYEYLSDGKIDSIEKIKD